ncbi:MAG: beta-ketoacyl-ACP synthase 3, partial [Treponema sp.]|nr:beta-ketoacyl-ACP synthase 3 [Treponema sp.]
MAIEIIGTGKAVPPNKVTNNDLTAKIDTSDEWIRSHSGIGSRYIADENTASSDLAAEAAKNALAMAAGYSGDDLAQRDKAAAEIAQTIDIIVLATVTPDFYGTPSTACILQDKIGAINAGAFDITATCSGFIYSLETAAGFLSINAQRKRALVVCAEVLSKLINWSDRSTCVLFGDGAGAVVLEKTGASSGGLMHTLLGADGSRHESLMMKRGGTRFPYKDGEVINKTDSAHCTCVEMNGQEVYNFAVKSVTDTITSLLKTGNITIDDVAYIVP